MKKTFKYMTLAAAAVLTAACSQENFTTSYLDDPNAVRITVQVGEGDVSGGFVTRSTPEGTTETDRNFKSDDRISVTADEQGPVVYAYNGSAWNPEESKFLKWNSSSMTFTAYYPVTEGTDANTFTLPADQSTADKIAAADYMIYNGSQSRGSDNNGVTLPMERKMARIVINPTLQSQFDGYEVTEVKVHGNTAGYSAGTAVAGTVEVTPYKHTDDKFYALLSPTTADNDSYFIDITVTKGDVSQTLHAKGIPATTAGKSYTVNLTVGINAATISGISINNWETGTVIGSNAEADLVPYVTFSAESEQTFKMDFGSFTLGTGEYFEYSVGGGKWVRFTAIVKDIKFGSTLGSLRLRGKSSKGTATDYDNYSTIQFTTANSQVDCTGDIRTLIDYENYADVSTADAKFCQLFYQNTQLRTAPALPAETLASFCYFYMFYGCTSLTTAPKLPAKTLASYCYSDMFNGCTSLTTAPELPAETLAEICYQGMFSGCTSLSTAPKLPAKTLASYCYSDMFNGCTSLTTAPELPAETLAEICYQGMFSGCTSLSTAPELPAETLAYGCYSDMFSGCTSLTTAPELPAETLAESCYSDMFYGCSSLSSVTMNATDVSAKLCLREWLDNAGTSASTRTLTLDSKSVYDSLVNALPDNWKKDVDGGATVNYLNSSSSSSGSEGGSVE